MQSRAQRQIGGDAVVHVPVTARQPLEQFGRARRVFVMRGIEHQRVHFAIESHEGDIVIARRRGIHPAGDAFELRPLLRRRAFGASPAQQPLDLAAHLHQQQLIARIEIGHQDALARQERHQALTREALQGFADRRAAEAGRGRQRLFGQHRAGLELQRDDGFLDRAERLLGQRFRGDTLVDGPLGGPFRGFGHRSRGLPAPRRRCR